MGYIFTYRDLTYEIIILFDRLKCIRLKRIKDLFFYKGPQIEKDTPPPQTAWIN